MGQPLSSTSLREREGAVQSFINDAVESAAQYSRPLAALWMTAERRACAETHHSLRIASMTHHS